MAGERGIAPGDRVEIAAAPGANGFLQFLIAYEAAPEGTAVEIFTGAAETGPEAGGDVLVLRMPGAACLVPLPWLPRIALALGLRSRAPGCRCRAGLAQLADQLGTAAVSLGLVDVVRH